jgi:putative addiction module component (TIGR02574 family)
MTTAAIREKLHYYINIADDKKVEAIYTMVESEIMENLDLWEDEEFLAEIDRRLKDYETGTVKCSTWEEVKQKAKYR